MPKKLIEVALPLEAINQAAAREKSLRHGHPSTLHRWWARRPLAACRAVLFASLVDDPSAHPECFPTEAEQEAERLRLFGILEKLVQWENSSNEQVLEAARAEIRRSTGGRPPPVLDPFCGSGSIPLEAQRLGLEAHASDLNPVAVLITKALVEIPPRFAGRPPVHPGRSEADRRRRWHGAQGLAEDVRYYGEWVYQEAKKVLGAQYPAIALPAEQGGGEAAPVAWLWARTARCPNPACGFEFPLTHSLRLSAKPARPVWLVPVPNQKLKRIDFDLSVERATHVPTGTISRRGAVCLDCHTPVSLGTLRGQAVAGDLRYQLLAVVVRARTGKLYLPATEEQASTALGCVPANPPTTELPERALGIGLSIYGIRSHRELFLPRQLAALSTFSDLVSRCWQRVYEDACKSPLPEVAGSQNPNAEAARAHADAVTAYLGLAVGKLVDYNCSLCLWNQFTETVTSAFPRAAIPMIWDCSEANPLGDASGGFKVVLGILCEALERLPFRCPPAVATQRDATAPGPQGRWVIATDPPYYANLGYAHLSDLFYIWLRRAVGRVYPDLFSTLLTPKEGELVADQFRHGTWEEARRWVESHSCARYAAISASFS